MDNALTLTLEEELNMMCGSVARSILASADPLDDLLSDPKMRYFAEQAAQRAVENAVRRGTLGAHCFYCGATDCGIKRCECGFGETFGCGVSRRYICDDCRAAHGRIARHLREMFAAPRVMRSNCRKFTFERELYRAARSLEGGEDYEAGVSQGLTYHLSQACAELQTPAEFRHAILDAFRLSKFLDYKQLAAALTHEKDATLLRSVTRNLQRTFRQQTGKEPRSRESTASDIPGAEFYR